MNPNLPTRLDRPSAAKGTMRKTNAKAPRAASREQVPLLLAELKRLGTAKRREEMAVRYGIHTELEAFGTTMADMQKIARRTGRDHALAEALWDVEIYEARMLAALVDVPEQVTAAQMDRWCADFDNWALCDTACMHLFDRTPHAFAKVEKWSRSRAEFVRRAAFALLASLALHGKSAGSECFARYLPLIEDAATDERNFVKKAVNWALRGIGECNAELHAAALVVAARLTDSANSAARWVGRDALRQLQRPAVIERLARRG
jgi:3-methyladenine DNA glycosylase AlkD